MCGWSPDMKDLLSLLAFLTFLAFTGSEEVRYETEEEKKPCTYFCKYSYNNGFSYIVLPMDISSTRAVGFFSQIDRYSAKKIIVIVVMTEKSSCLTIVW